MDDVASDFSKNADSLNVLLFSLIVEKVNQQQTFLLIHEWLVTFILRNTKLICSSSALQTTHALCQKKHKIAPVLSNSINKTQCWQRCWLVCSNFGALSFENPVVPSSWWEVVNLNGLSSDLFPPWPRRLPCCLATIKLSSKYGRIFFFNSYLIPFIDYIIKWIHFDYLKI